MCAKLEVVTLKYVGAAPYSPVHQYGNTTANPVSKPGSLLAITYTGNSLIDRDTKRSHASGFGVLNHVAHKRAARLHEHLKPQWPRSRLRDLADLNSTVKSCWRQKDGKRQFLSKQG